MRIKKHLTVNKNESRVLEFCTSYDEQIVTISQGCRLGNMSAVYFITNEMMTSNDKDIELFCKAIELAKEVYKEWKQNCNKPCDDILAEEVDRMEVLE